MTKQSGRALAVALTAGVVLCLSGCGEQQPSGPGYASKDKVVQKTASDAPLARGEIISVVYKAAMEAGSAHMEVTMSGPTSLSLRGDAMFGDRGSAMNLTMRIPSLGKDKVELRYVGKMLYVAIPGLTPSGKFLKADPTDRSSPLAKEFAGLADEVNPMRLFKTIDSALTSVDRVGVQKLDGTSLTHYRLTADAGQLMQNLRREGRTEIPKSLTGANESIAYDLWLDEKNLLRKMTVDFGGTSAETVLSKWGQPVEVARPAASDIVEMPGA